MGEDVLVVGAGPTGLTLACELYRRGVPCRIVDRRTVHIDRSRAVDLQPRTLQIFDDLGIAGSLIEQGHQLSALSIYDSPKRLARLEFKGNGTRYPHAYALPQTQTEDALEARLRELGGKVERGVRLTALERDEGGATVLLSNGGPDAGAAHFKWVVGCDGAASTVRTAAGIEFEGRGTKASFVTADADLDLALPRDEISLFLSPSGFLMLLPLPGARRYRIIIDTESADDRPDDEASLTSAISAYLGGEVVLHELGMVATYHVQRRLAKTFRMGRVLLAGDAAHTFNPVGGHGMNQGVQDAYNLGWKLALVVTGRGPDALLSSYQSERRNAARVFTREMDFSARLRLSKMAVESEEYDRLMDFSVVAPPLRRSVLDAALSPHWMYQSGSFVREVVASGFESPDSINAGSLAPDVVYGDAEDERISTLIRGPLHRLLLFAGERGAERAHSVPKSVVDLATEVSGRWGEVLEVILVVAGGGQADGWSGRVVRDGRARLHGAFGAPLPCAYLVRPDGHVGFRCTPLSAGAVRDHLMVLFSPGIASLI